MHILACHEAQARCVAHLYAAAGNSVNCKGTSWNFDMTRVRGGTLRKNLRIVATEAAGTASVPCAGAGAGPGAAAALLPGLPLGCCADFLTSSTSVMPAPWGGKAVSVCQYMVQHTCMLGSMHMKDPNSV